MVFQKQHAISTFKAVLIGFSYTKPDTIFAFILWFHLFTTDVTHWESKLHLSGIKAALNELNAIKYGLQFQLKF